MEMAKQHVWFKARFGEVESVEEDGKFYSEKPESFEEWVEIGCPGINPSSLEIYFKLNPL